MVGISTLVSVLVIVLTYTFAESESDLHVKISQLESQLNLLTRRVQLDEENLDNLTRQLKNVTALEEKIQRWNKKELLISSRRYANSSDPIEVAFTVVLNHELNDVPLHTTLIFDFLIHMSGTSYDVNTGIFTCPTSGLYLFSVFIESNSVNTEAAVGLIKEGKSYMSVISERIKRGEDDTGGNVCLLNVYKGERVWVETYGYDKQSFYPSFTTFSGVLIHRH